MQNITIQSLFRKDYSLLVSEDITINQLKDKITKSIYDTPAHNQRLLYWGQNLENSRSIRDYFIKDKGVIHLIVTMDPPKESGNKTKKSLFQVIKNLIKGE
jgi:ubiquitin domain-containing protein